MIKIKYNIVMGISFILLTYVITLYLNGFVNNGLQLYVYEFSNKTTLYSSETLLLGIVLWLIPKMLMAYYLANEIFKSYKKTYAYYYVRSRDSRIWMKRHILQLGVSACIFSIMKLVLAMSMEPTYAYIAMALLEVLCMSFISFLIFIVLLITDNEKISIFVMIAVISSVFMVTELGNETLLNMVFFYQNAMVSSIIVLFLCIVSIISIFHLLKRKEFYY